MNRVMHVEEESWFFLRLAQRPWRDWMGASACIGRFTRQGSTPA